MDFIMKPEWLRGAEAQQRADAGALADEAAGAAGGGLDVAGELAGAGVGEGLPAGVVARGALALAGDAPAVNLTQTQALAQSLGVPEGVLARQPEYMRREILARHLEGNPGLGNWARGGALRAALARDNAAEAQRAAAGFEPLGRVWKGWEETGRVMAEYPADVPVLTDPFRNFYNGWLDMARGIMAAGKSVPDMALGPESAISKWFGRWVETIRDMELETGEPKSFGGRLARDVVRNVPQIGAQVATWLMAGPAAATGLMFGYIYGQDYDRLTGMGISPENSAFAGAVDGALQAGLERIGLGALMRAGGKEGWKAIAGAAGAGAIKEGVTEAAQHMPEYVTELWAKSSLYSDDLDERAKWTWEQASDAANLVQGTKDALYEGLVGAILGGPVAAGHAWAQGRKAGVDETDRLLAGIREHAAGSMARLELARAMGECGDVVAKNRNDPAAATAVLENSLPENMRRVWLDAADAASILADNAINPQGVVEALGGNVEQINAAMAAGLPLEVNLAAFMAHGLEQNHWEKLRLEPDGPDLSQARAFDPDRIMEDITRVLNQDDDLEDFPLGDREKALAMSAREMRARKTRTRREIKRLAAAMGELGMTPLEAGANAALIEAHALAWHERYGVDPQIMLEKWKIVPGVETGGKTRGQVSISNREKLIRLFKRRNVSTMPHEAGHIFVDDLISIAKSRGRIALAAFMDEGRALARADAEIADGLQARLDEGAGYGSQADFMARLAENLREEAKKHAALAEEARKEAQVLEGTEHVDRWSGAASIASREQTRAEIKASLARLAKRTAGHIEAEAQALEDVHILARYAGLNEAETALVLGERKKEGRAGAYVKIQEKAAEGFVEYLRAGRSPKGALAAVFARMRQWLTSLLMRSAKLAPQLGAETAGVFDRLLATDREIALNANLARMQTTEKEFSGSWRLDGEDRKQLKNLLARAQTMSWEKLARIKRKRREKFYRARVKALEAELAREPFWQLVENGNMQRGDAMQFLGKKATEELEVLRPGFLKDNAPAGDFLAMELGFESGERLICAIHERLVVNGETRRQKAELMAMAEMAQAEEEDARQMQAVDCEAFGNYLDAADQAVARVVAGMRRKAGQDLEKYAENMMTPRVLVRQQASQILSAMPLRKITQARLQTMLNKALAERNRLLESGRPEDVMGAQNALNSARVAVEMLDLCAGFRKNADRLRQKAKKLANARAGSMGAAQLEALRKVFDAWALARMRQPADLAYARLELSELVKNIAGDGEVTGVLPTFPDWLLNLANPETGLRGAANGRLSINDLTPFQLAELENLVDFLAHSGKEDAEARARSESALVERAAYEAAAAMNRLPPVKNARPDSARAFFRRLFASVDILLWESRKADGLRNVNGDGRPGPMESLCKQMFAADERVRGWTDKVGRAMRPHLKTLTTARKRLEARYGRNMDLRRGDGSLIKPPVAWQKAYGQDRYTFDMLLAMALHCGTASNMQRLTAGYQSTRDASGKSLADGLDCNDIACLLGDDVALSVAVASRGQGLAELRPNGREGLFTLEEWDAIQGIWDSLALLWPDTRAAHKKLFGFSPEQVLPQALRVRAGGRQKVLAGGYFPVSYDPNISDRVGAWSEAEDLLARNEARFSAPSAKRGHTMNRTKNAPGLPLRLDTSVIGRHVSEAAKFIEYGQLVRRYDRIIRRDEFAQAYKRAYGSQDYDAIRDNLRGLVRQEQPGDVVSMLERKVRKFLVPWGLAWNPNVAALQMTAIFPAMGDLGAKPMLKSLAFMAVNGMDAARQIWKASPYMFSRMTNMDQDLARNIEMGVGRKKTFAIGGREYSWDDVVDAGMKMIVGVDAAATCAVWLAAYQKKMAQLVTRPKPQKRPAENPPAEIETDWQKEFSSESDQDSPDDTLDVTSPVKEDSLEDDIFGPDPAKEKAREREEQRAKAAAWFESTMPPVEEDGAAGEKNAGEESGHRPETAGAAASLAGQAQNPDNVQSPASAGASASLGANAQAGQAKASGTGQGSAPEPRHWFDRLNPLSALAPLTRGFYGQAQANGSRNPVIDFESEFHEQAARYADMVVKQSNPDFDPTSRSSFLRANGMARLLNQFASAITLFASRDHYLNVAREKGALSRVGHARQQFYTYVLPAIALSLFFWLLRDRDDDRASLAKTMGSYTIDQFSMKMPVFGSAVGGAAYRLFGLDPGARNGGLRTSLDAPFDLAANVLGQPGRLGKKTGPEQKKAAIYAIADLLSFIARVPVSKVARKAERGWEQRKRGEGNWASLIFPKPGK